MISAKLLGACEAGKSGLLGGFLGAMDGHVVFRVDCERFHLSSLFPTACGVDDIHRSSRGNKQGNSAEKICHGEWLAMTACPNLNRLNQVSP
jgi:hypothetical protein